MNLFGHKKVLVRENARCVLTAVYQVTACPAGGGSTPVPVGGGGGAGGYTSPSQRGTPVLASGVAPDLVSP